MSVVGINIWGRDVKETEGGSWVIKTERAKER